MTTDLQALTDEIEHVFAPVFAQMEWAEDEIEQAQRRHPWCGCDGGEDGAHDYW